MKDVVITLKCGKNKNIFLPDQYYFNTKDLFCSSSSKLCHFAILYLVVRNINIWLILRLLVSYMYLRCPQLAQQS